MNTTPRRWLIFCCAASTILSCLWCFYEFGWEPVVVSFGSLTALVGLLVFPSNSTTSPLQGYSAGSRLKWCRKQFRLTRSEMTEKRHKHGRQLGQGGQNGICPPLEIT